jgi:glutamate racemase
MACGTSSAIAYPVLKDNYKVQMISMIEPGAQAAVAASRSGRIGLMATVGTVNSGAYQNAVTALKKEAKVAAVACPLFVPLIEGGFVDGEEAKKVVKEYLKPLLKENIDALILGCTHYPHLARVIGEKAGPNVVLVDPAEAAVREAKQLLQKAGTLKDKNLPPKYEYLVTGPVVHFQEVGSRLLGKPITHAKHVII